MSTNIEWTDRVWNPVTGCTKVSAGCKNCYAERIAGRKLPQGGFTDREFTEVRTHEDRLTQPLSWRKEQRVFVNSMSDLFHESVPFEFIYRVFTVMALSDHTFQILTKRPERMKECIDRLDNSTRLPGYADWPQLAPNRWLTEQIGPRRMQEICEKPDVSNEWPMPNVWLGVSVENQETADQRIPELLNTRAAVRFVSYEPALGPVDFVRGGWSWLEPLFPPPGNYRGWDRGLDWIIVGGESGPGARPFDVEWARSTVRQCKAAGVPVFVKQLGADPWDRSTNVGFAPGVASQKYNIRTPKLKDRKGGDPSEWTEDLRVREFPAVSR